ncbi:MAG: TonB-dependent receptor [bacterium]
MSRPREMYRRVQYYAHNLILLCFLALLAMGTSARAQVPARGTIQGTVRDSATNEPWAGVAVTIDGTQRGTLTDSLGRFLLGGLDAGTYLLRTRLVSARSAEARVVVSAGATTRVEIRLANAVVTLGAVRAQARTPERDRFELNPSVGSISLTKNNVTTVPSLGEPDVLRTVQLLPGVNARNDFSSGYNVRGGESDQNLILLDGYPIYNPFHLGGLFSTFLDETVGSIDLLTGGFGAAYGSRLSSILNVKSAEPERAGLHGEAGISVIASSLSVGSMSDDGRSSWTVSGRRTYADKLIALISSQSFPYHFSDAQFHGVRALGKDNLRLDVSAYSGADVLDGNLSTATTNDSTPEAAGGGTFTFGWTNQLVGATLRNVWRDNARLPLLGAADSAGFEQHVSFTRFATGLDLGAGALTLTNSVHELRLAGDVHWNRGAHERRLGYEASGYAIHYDVNSTTTQTQLFQLQQHPTATTLYYQENWKPTSRLILNAGLRAEHITGRDWTGLSPRASLKYFVTPDLALTAAVGEYAQWLHSLNREDIPVRIFDFWVASDAFVEVSRARHYVLGMEQWLGATRFMKVEGWAKQYDHLLEQNTADDPSRRGDEFLDSQGLSYGFDVLLRQLDIGPVGGWVAYTYGVSARSRNDVGYWPGQDRRHNLNVITTYKLAKRYTMSARFGLATGTPYTEIVGEIVRRSYDPVTHTFNGGEGTRSVEPQGGVHNAERYPVFQRLDLSVARESMWRGMKVTPYVSLVNAYNAHNVFIYTFSYTNSPPTRETSSQLPFLPTLGVTASF